MLYKDSHWLVIIFWPLICDTVKICTYQCYFIRIYDTIWYKEARSKICKYVTVIKRSIAYYSNEECLYNWLLLLFQAMVRSISTNFYWWWRGESSTTGKPSSRRRSVFLTWTETGECKHTQRPRILISWNVYTLLWLLYLYAAQFITADLTQCFLSWRVTAFLLRVVVLWEIIRPRRRGFIGYLVRCKCAEAKWASCSTVPAFSWTRNESSVGWLARTKSRFYGSSVYTCYTVGRGALYLCYCAFGNETVNVNQLTSEIV